MFGIIIQTFIFAGVLWWIGDTKSSVGTLIALDSMYSMTEILMGILLQLFAQYCIWLSPYFGFWDNAEGTFLDRYLLYGTYMCSKLILTTLTYNVYPYWLDFGGLLIAIPEITKYILSTQGFKHWSSYIWRYCQKWWRQFICVLFAGILNQMSVVIFNLNPQISRKEISSILKDYSYDHIHYFIKTFILTNIIQQFKESIALSEPIMRLLYNQGALIEISANHRYEDPFVDIVDPVEKIRTILMKRRFEQFYNPHILMILNRLYSQKNPSYIQVYVKKYIRELEYLTGIFCALYTAVSFFQCLELIFPLAILLIPWHSDWNTIAINASIELIGIGLSYYTNTYLVGAFMCSYGPTLLNNKIIHWVLIQTKKRIRKWYWLLFHKNTYNWHILITGLQVWIIGNTPLDPILKGIFLFLQGNLVIYPEIYLWYILMGQFSSYRIIHLIVVGCYLYLGINIYDHRNAPQEIINPQIIKSYLIKKVPDDPVSLCKTHLLETQPISSLIMYDFYEGPILSFQSGSHTSSQSESQRSSQSGSHTSSQSESHTSSQSERSSQSQRSSQSERSSQGTILREDYVKSSQCLNNRTWGSGIIIREDYIDTLIQNKNK